MLNRCMVAFVTAQHLPQVFLTMTDLGVSGRWTIERKHRQGRAVNYELQGRTENMMSSARIMEVARPGFVPSHHVSMVYVCQCDREPWSTTVPE